MAIGSQDPCILGIWGMGGIGKTTIAETIFSQISCQFEGCCFLKDVREESERNGIQKLLEELMSQALGDSHIKIYTPSLGPGISLIRRLHRKQILVVLDDVDDPQQLECLVGNPCWFGPGSRIIVTSRNKQAFESRADSIYEVKPLNDDASLRLFSQHAFKQNHPLEDHKPLSGVVVRYCQGNPLALKVLGSFLFGKNKIEWESAVNKLEKVPMNKIQEKLKISYDSLDREEKEIFLHIACFFKGYDMFIVIQMLNSCGFHAVIGIRNLIDKSLLTQTYSCLKMHDLLQEMGREIVREESKEPGERSRLWDSQDIYQVFKNNTGTRKVEGIFLNVSKLSEEIHLNPKAFENMSNLKFLKIYDWKFVKGWKVHLSQGLDYLPNELRYLYWHGYPLEYLPADFSPKNLLSVELSQSNIKGFWKEAEPESIVRHCSSLRQFSMLTCLRLVGCQNLTSLPNNVDMRCLDTLDLSGCSRLVMFPEVSRNIKYPSLSMTAIRKVPSSVEYLDRLVNLRLEFCTELVSLPTNIYKLKRLEYLQLEGCGKLKVLPEIRESMDNLKTLIFGWLTQSSMEGFRNASLTSWFGMSCLNLFGLTHLVLINCNLEQLPAYLGCLSSLDGLSLGGNNFESIPESIKQLTRLEFLGLQDCRRLQSLPELPASLYELDATGCTSLENVSSLNQLLFDRPFVNLQVELRDCFKVDKNQRDPISRFRNRYSVKPVKVNSYLSGPMVSFRYPGGRIPEWCMNQSTGDSVRIPLPSNWLNDAFLGFIFCFVLAADSDSDSDPAHEINIHFNWHFGDDCDDGGYFTTGLDSSSYWEPMHRNYADHVVLLHDWSVCDYIKAENRPRLTQGSYDAVSFKFHFCDDDSDSKIDEELPNPWEVKKCGAIPWYAQD